MIRGDEFDDSTMVMIWDQGHNNDLPRNMLDNIT